jgi:hypothetical protein
MGSHRVWVPREVVIGCNGVSKPWVSQVWFRTETVYYKLTLKIVGLFLLQKPDHMTTKLTKT